MTDRLKRLLPSLVLAGIAASCALSDFSSLPTTRDHVGVFIGAVLMGAALAALPKPRPTTTLSAAEPTPENTTVEPVVAKPWHPPQGVRGISNEEMDAKELELPYMVNQRGRFYGVPYYASPDGRTLPPTVVPPSAKNKMEKP